MTNVYDKITEEEEVWKRCPGYERQYDISNMGNVRSFHIGKGKIDRSEVQRIMTPQINTYIQVILSKGLSGNRLVFVHVLVAKAFIYNPQKKKYVHHKNNNKLDPRASNLEWVTSGENQKYAYADGQRERPHGEKNGRCLLSSEDVLKIFKCKTKTIYKLATQYNVKVATIADIKSGRNWSNITGRAYKKRGYLKLSNEIVLAIYNAAGDQRDIAKRYGTKQPIVSSIKTGRTYSLLTGQKFTGNNKVYNYQ